MCWKRHNTVARNVGGDGSGITIAGNGDTVHYVVVTNTVLVSHSVGISVTAGNTATLNGVLWYGNDANRGGTGKISVAHAITGHPAFAADGYHLTADSSAVDAGVHAGLTTDIDGDSRPDSCFDDLGADEHISDQDCQFIYLPLVQHHSL